MSECNHDCESCKKTCGERKTSFQIPPHDGCNIKKVIGVVSGKGGVGKSMITCITAVLMNRRGFRTAVLDADITGPSVPKAFGIKEKADGTDNELFPVISRSGIELMSVNLLLPDETDPVIWRGPIIAGTVKQFWSEVVWGDVDYMFVDMPPGTGDVPLTVFQSLPLDGIIVVTSPQELVSMIVGKAVKMAKMMNVPIIGVVENMSYAVCPDCGKRLNVFGESRIAQTAAEYGVKVLAQLPIDPEAARLADSGRIEDIAITAAEAIADAIEEFCK